MNKDSSKQGIKFCYFYERRNQGKRLSKGHGGIITAMTELCSDTQVLKVAFAYCSPKDIFNKKIAHQICQGRIQNNRWIETPFTGNSFIDVANYWNEMDEKFKPKFCKRWNINSETGDIWY